MLSVVLPTYNEKENIAVLIPLLQDLFKEYKIEAEIIVADDSSPDGTGDVALKLNKKYKNIKLLTRKKKEGIGSALVDGYNESNNDIIISMDSDLSFDHRDILRLLERINDGYDMVLGCRHTESSNYQTNKLTTTIKSKISRYGNKLTTIILGLDVHDFSANFRAMRREVWKNIKTFEKGNSFLLEMVIAANSKGYKITEIPVTFKDRIYGESKISFNFIKEIPKVFLKLVKFRLKEY